MARERLVFSPGRIFPFSAVGRWWDRNEEIDLVGINKELDSILFGEVKWTEKLVGTDIYRKSKAESPKSRLGG